MVPLVLTAMPTSNSLMENAPAKWVMLTTVVRSVLLAANSPMASSSMDTAQSAPRTWLSLEAIPADALKGKVMQGTTCVSQCQSD